MQNIQFNTKKLEKNDILFLEQNAERYLELRHVEMASKIFVTKGFYARHESVKNDKIIEIEDFYEALFKSLEERYQTPKIKIAITGTNGKTTIAWMLFSMCNMLKHNGVYFGTLGIYFCHNGIITQYENATLTTHEICKTYQLLDQFTNQYNTEYAFFEASSHGLEQNRFGNMKFDHGVFSNFSQDHLDYHGTMENYLASKLKLAAMIKDNGTFFINKNIPIKTHISNAVYVFDNNIYIKDNQIIINDVIFDIKPETPFFQIENTAFVLLIAQKIFQHLSHKELKKNIMNITTPKGRIERVTKDRNIFIDFAHTPDGIEKLLQSVRSKYQNIIVLFGCGGDRDPKKRPIMLKAALLADCIIVTDDNPRTEDPMQIRKDILHNCIKTTENDRYTKYQHQKDIFEIKTNRQDAIKFGIELYQKKPESALFILGKGHEEYQIVGKEKLSFNEKEIILENLNK